MCRAIDTTNRNSNNSAAGGGFMKRLAIGVLVLGFFLNGNTHSFAQTQEQLIAGAKKEGKLVVYASATRHSYRCTLPYSTKDILSSKLNFFAPASRSS